MDEDIRLEGGLKGGPEAVDLRGAEVVHPELGVVGGQREGGVVRSGAGAGGGGEGAAGGDISRFQTPDKEDPAQRMAKGFELNEKRKEDEWEEPGGGEIAWFKTPDKDDLVKKRQKYFD